MIKNLIIYLYYRYARKQDILNKIDKFLMSYKNDFLSSIRTFHKERGFLTVKQMDASQRVLGYLNNIKNNRIIYEEEDVLEEDLF